MDQPFDPYLQWLGIRDPQRPPNHYRLLGLEQLENDAAIISLAADRQMAHVRQFQAGRHSDLAQRLLNELSAARICLLKPDRKADYDRQLRVQQAPPKAAPSNRAADSASFILIEPGKPTVLPAKPPSYTAWYILAGSVAVCGGLVTLLIVNNRPGTTDTATTATVKVQPAVKAPSVPTAKPTKTAPQLPVTTSSPSLEPAVNKTEPTKPDAVTVLQQPAAEYETGKTVQSEAKHPEGLPLVGELPTENNRAELELAQVELAQPPSLVDPADVQVNRRKIPDKTVINAKQKEIREIFKAEYAARQPEARAKLAGELYKSAMSAPGDLDTKYVLLCEARDIAESVGVLELIKKVNAELQLTFQAGDTDYLGTLNKLIAIKNRPITFYQELLTELQTTADQAVQSDDYDQAVKAMNMGIALAKNLQDLSTLNSLNLKLKEANQIKQLYVKAKSAKEALLADPNNASANTIWGSYLCFAKNNFADGLLFLVRGDDAVLAALAKKDLQTGVKEAEQLSVADEWWFLAEKEKDRTKAAMRARAGGIYSTIRPKLTGLNLAKVEKRLKEWQADGGTAVGGTLASQLPNTSWNFLLENPKLVDKYQFLPQGKVVHIAFDTWTVQGNDIVLTTKPGFNPPLVLYMKPAGDKVIVEAYYKADGKLNNRGVAVRVTE